MPKIDLRASGSAVYGNGTGRGFQFPQRFELEYIGEDHKHHRPVRFTRSLALQRFFGVSSKIMPETFRGVTRCGAVLPIQIA